MAKLHDTEERLRSQLRELTEQCRQLREELERFVRPPAVKNAMAEDRPMPPPRIRPRAKKR